MTIVVRPSSTPVITRRVVRPVVTSDDSREVVVNESERRVIVESPTRPVHVRVGGVQGPQGVPGSGTFVLTAGAGGISALRVVVAEDDVARYPDITATDDAARVIGLSYTAAAAGSTFIVQPDGVVNEPSWTWSPGVLWCGADGVLTQTIPAAPAWLMEIGRVRSPTSIVLDLQSPIIRN